MLPRLYVPSLEPRDRTVELPEDEAGHLRRVLRVKTGAAVRLFDGRGHEVAARVTAADRSAVVVEVQGPVTAAPEWDVQVTLAQAVLKGDKIDDVIRDAVMMGVAAIQPLLSARTDVPASAFTKGRRVDRWHRIAVASAKQCGRAVVPAVRPPLSLADCLGSDESDTRLMLVEPAAAMSGIAPLPVRAAPASATLLVGPEGGWADEEVVLAFAAGCLPMSLGPRTLRADAAPLVALSVLQCVWGEIPGLGTGSGFGKGERQRARDERR
jgi:16S rRNA (uracil1498-N3)-methyltransferase